MPSVATPHATGGITAIVPARDEEAVIAACVESLAKQSEITEIVVVNDQSSDKTAAIVRDLATRIAKLRLLEAQEPPAGWVGKNNALTIGARNATQRLAIIYGRGCGTGRGRYGACVADCPGNPCSIGFLLAAANHGKVVRKSADTVCILQTRAAIFLCRRE